MNSVNVRATIEKEFNDFAGSSNNRSVERRAACSISHIQERGVPIEEFAYPANVT
jgi:hypothetical protein